MRILMLSSEPPFPLRNGNQIYEYNLARELRRRHEIDLVCPTVSREEAAAAASLESVFNRVLAVPARRRGHAGRLGALVTGKDWLYNRDDLPALRKKIKDVLGGHDLVHVNSLGMTPYAALLGSIPKIAVPYDCQSLLYDRRAARSRGWDAVYSKAQSIRLGIWERVWLPRFDRCVVVSPVDAGALEERAPGLGAEVIPFGVDTERFQPGNVPEEGATIVFTGNMAYFPNSRAARELATEVFPLVRRRIPHALLKIVGDAGGSLRAELQGRGVEVVGFTDVRPHLASAAVCVSPLRVGSGFKNKVVEAMAMGKALVATPLSMDGIEAVDGEHFIAAERPEEIAGAAVRLLEDAELRRAIGGRARALVTRKYSWRRAADSFDALYTKLAVRPAPAGRGEAA